MKPKTKPESFIRQPKYSGGKKAMDEFIRTSMKYPEEALRNKREGSVAVAFDIDVYGKVTSAAVKNGIGYGCDEEAVRLVKLLRFEKKKYQGLRVTFHTSLVIHFRLPPAPPKPQEINIQYQFTGTSKTEQSEKKITWTINT